MRATRATRARPRPVSGSRSTARSRSSDAAGVRPGREDGEPAARLLDPGTDALRRLARAGGQLVRARARHRHHEVEAVEERPRDLVAVRRDPRGRALALEPGVAACAARTEVHRRDEAEARGKEGAPADPRDGDDAVLERLTERLQHGPWELGQLVQEEHAPVREADLTRPRHRAAADHGRRRGAVVRRPERRRGDEARAGRERAGHRVDPRHLERLVVRQRREDRRQAAGEHGLARARRPREQEVVRTGRRQLERPAAAFLPADVPEVGQGRRGGARLVGRSGSDLLVAAQVADRLGEVPHAHDLDPRESRLARRLVRAEDAGETRADGALGRRDRPRHRPDAAVEAQLADARVGGEPLARKLGRRGEHGQGDGEVEARPLLPQRRGREVDRDRPSRPLEERRVDAAPHAVLRLLAGAVCEADDRERRLLARPQVRLDLDAPRLEPHERERDGAAEHPSTVRPAASRVCAGFVPTSCRRVGRARRPTRRSARSSGWISRRSRGRTA